MQTHRFAALDVFRGMTVCFMIIVNTPGSYEAAYAPLRHAQWHGFTPTDLVFPSFMFAVGNAMSFAMKKWNTMSDAAVLGKIFKRTIIIFLLGYLMYWFPFVHWNETGSLDLNPIGKTRIMGVLQRIALAYGMAALMIHYLKLNTVLRLSFSFLFIYWLILLLFRGSADPYDMITNAGTRLDLWLFGPDHLYHGEGVAFDPEGLLSTLPSIANVTFGYAAGRWIQEKARPNAPLPNDSAGQMVGRGNNYESLTKLLLTGVTLIFLALCWNNFHPINKKLWTGSYVFLTVGIDCVLLAALMYIIDFLQINRFNYFFEVFGRNPLFIYLLSEIAVVLLWFIPIGNTPLYQWLFQNVFSRAGLFFGSFLFALTVMLCCWMVGFVLDKRRIYVRV
jgi:predicted acyltransferase